MCGRFTLRQSAEEIAQAFQIPDVPPLEPRYNIAPTQPVATVLKIPENSDRQFRMLHWGLIPFWADDPKLGSKLINARAESVAEKPAFRSAFRHRRCLIVTDGFYEWQQQENGKQPFYLRLKDDRPFAFAGLWEHWEEDGGEAIDSCTILTTNANELTHPIHSRMPVILDPKDYDLWLDPSVSKSETLQPLLRPYDSEKMEAYPVSKTVNRPTNDRPECIELVEA
jgi:putative SOS response-associated peptidase YedK